MESLRNVSEGFIKLRGDCRENFGGRGRGHRKLGGEILGGTVREDSLALCLMCFEVKNDYQIWSPLKVYLGRSTDGGGGRTLFIFGEF